MINYKRLLHAGFDCDVYEINEDYVYKHYPMYKYGRAICNRVPPIEFLKSIDSPHVEKVIDHDYEGFITYRLQETAGDYYWYKLRCNTDKQYEALENISSLLKTYSHNDLTPDNIGVQNNGNIVVLDWSQQGESPYYDFLNDLRCLENWSRNIKKPGRWFMDDHYGIIVSYILKAIVDRVIKDGLDYLSINKIISEYINRLDAQKHDSVVREKITFFIGEYKELLLENHRRLT